MVSLWYPAQRVHGYPLAPWLPPAAWARFEQDQGIPPGVLQVPLTHGRVGAPVEHDRGGRPVVLYSPGLGSNRDSGTVLVEELVSRGYIVVTIDHTHDASAVEFPDGRVETPAMPPFTPEVLEKAVAVRVADTRFVLDTLAALNAGANPDAEHRRLPSGLRGALRLSSVGMFGHSLGGATAAAAMLEDQRIQAGVNLDGTLFGPVVDAGLDRPFMLVGAEGHGRDSDQSWAKFWANLRGWRLNLQLTGSAHNSFTDLQVMVPQTAGALGLPPEVVQAGDRHHRPTPVHRQSARLPHRVLQHAPSSPRQPPARPPLATLPRNAVPALTLSPSSEHGLLDIIGPGTVRADDPACGYIAAGSISPLRVSTRPRISSRTRRDHVDEAVRPIQEGECTGWDRPEVGDPDLPAARPRTTHSRGRADNRRSSIHPVRDGRSKSGGMRTNLLQNPPSKIRCHTAARVRSLMGESEER